MCTYGQLSEVQMVRDLDLDLGSARDHINIHSISTTTSVPNHQRHALPKYDRLNFVKYRHWTKFELS